VNTKPVKMFPSANGSTLMHHRREGRKLPILLTFLCGFFAACSDAVAAHSEQQIELGVIYWNDRFPEKPLSIHVVKVDRKRPEFHFIATKAKNAVLGLATLTEQIKLVPAVEGVPKVAINGDFYKTERERYPGDPRGLLITSGELVSSPTDRACLWFDPQGDPHMEIVASQFSVTWSDGKSTPIGLNEDPGASRTVLFTPRLGASTGTSNRVDLILERNGDAPWLPLRIGEDYSARIREINIRGNVNLSTNIMVLTVTTQTMLRTKDLTKGAVIRIGTHTTPEVKGANTALGGGPALVHAGEVAPIKRTTDPRAASAYSERALFEPHPRSAIGWNDKFFYFVEVDGRQKDLSMGITLADLSAYLVKIGCTEAMNLDGGGSSTIWLNGKVMNSPCFGYLRNTATALVMVSKEN